MLAGTFLSNIGLAVSDFANQKKVFFLAAEPLTDAITWSKGNRYTFRLRPNTYMQSAMLVPEAATQKHLEILSEIAELLSDAGLREQIKSSTDAAALHGLIAGWQSTQVA